ncbi:carbohydrate-binding protein [Mycobacterium sp. ENV421]|uniref:DUF4185 domain-containing protein n=1 Tax=Mycobacterium sp. ENV421 TaxID=1213407 RepID=UPI000C9A59DE|nr:DUF4185 domain-containing protein [Mycobacterium sp. ENV421]PND59125.1 carbohydrate-binding protein [Mycobacterium sp. ENV421]
MRAAAYIGGIGGFAVALGVGAAVTAGCGVASADSAESGSSATHSSSATRSAVGHPQRTKPKAIAASRLSKPLPAKQTRAVTVRTSAAAVTTAPVTTKVGWVTGPNTSTPGRFGVYGTDVGIMWDNGMAGDRRQVLMIFGDTFSGPNMTGNWRSNVLLRTTDPINRVFAPGSATDPFAGSPLASPGMSKQVIAGSARNLGPFGSQVTVIPTAAISVPYDNQYGARQYVNFMSVRSWDFGGAWTTNYSAIAYSDDNGQNWTVAPQTVRAASWLRSSTPFVYGNQNFQQGAFVKPPADSPDAGYVFSYGTPSGRLGSAYLSRVSEADILDLTKYQYWNGTDWVTGKPGAAVPILPTTRSNQYAGGILGQLGLFFGSWVAGIFGVGGPSGHVSELSVQYNTYLNKYVAMYSSSVGSVIIRTADTPQGTWSAPTTLVTSAQYPGLYAPMMDPWSTGQDIYWNMSVWGSYNVLLMKTTLGGAAVQA